MIDDQTQLFDLTQVAEDLRIEHQVSVQESYHNLLTGEVPVKDFPFDHLPQRPIKGGGVKDFVPGWWFIREANNLFDYRWGFKVVEKSIEEKFIWVYGEMTVTVPAKVVERTYPDGTIVREHLDGYSVTKGQFGGTEIKRLQKNNAIMDLGNDLKAAATDSFKKCCTLFGMAASVYKTGEMKAEQKAPTETLNAYYSVFEKAGRNRAEAIQFAKDETSVEPEEATEAMLIELLPKARAHIKNAG